ncbi:DUF4488 domain-containing protein [Ornithobacterium rhinotracheale]
MNQWFKKIGICAFLSLASLSFAQQHIAESKNLVGIWQHVYPISNENYIKTGNYKIITPDGTFSLVFIGKNKTTLTGYGTYKITSDSTFTEKMISHISPKFDKSGSILRYKMQDENTLLQSFKAQNNDRWVPEIWKRITMPKKDSFMKEF